MPNAYMSFKKVTKTPNDAQVLSTGSIGGTKFVAAVTPGDYPAFYLKMFPEGASEPVLVRVDFTRLVASLIAAEAAEEDRWTPLVEGTVPGRYGNEVVTASVVKSTLDDGTGYAHICYHRHDRAPIRDWRIGQRIKNELAGPEWEAVEMYPAESRVVDTSNEYHLFCMDAQFPFGYNHPERATQAQIDEQYDGPGEGPVQRDDPDADTSGFDWHDASVGSVRTPDGIGHRD